MPPFAADLLDVWEQARHCAPPSRSLRLLAWALPDRTPDALADLDLGARDWHLLRLRQALFGPGVEARGDCPHCGAPIEVAFDLRDVQDAAPPPDAPVFVDGGGRRFRLPNSRDLVAVSQLPDVEAAEQALLDRLALEPAFSDATDPDEVDSGLAALAAQRRLRLDLDCELCDGRWTLDFDPGGFLWQELEARAQRLLDDVARLAWHFGWSERDILALGDSRRAAYLERTH